MIFSNNVKSSYFARDCQIRSGIYRGVRAAALLSLIMSLPFAAVAQNALFSTAEDLFLRNKPAEAVPALEAAFRDDPINVMVSLYLGLAYYQTGRLDETIDTLRKALPRAGDRTAVFAYNLGNAFFAKGSAAFAEPYYTQAIAADPNFASAYLNRAQTRIKMGSLRDAIADYRQYLVLSPNTPQRNAIEQVIALIDAEYAAEERRRIAAEEAARAEAERRQRLLDEVAASLQAASEQTKGLQAGGEDVLQYNGEFVLE